MNVHVLNDGYTTVFGLESEPFAVIEWTHKITGHEFKKVCFEHEEMMALLNQHRQKGNYYENYIPNILYSKRALILYGMGGEVYATN